MKGLLLSLRQLKIDHESGRKEKSIDAMDDFCGVYSGDYCNVDICTNILLGSFTIPVNFICIRNGLGINKISVY